MSAGVSMWIGGVALALVGGGCSAPCPEEYWRHLEGPELCGAMQAWEAAHPEVADEPRPWVVYCGEYVYFQECVPDDYLEVTDQAYGAFWECPGGCQTTTEYTNSVGRRECPGALFSVGCIEGHRL